MALIRNFFVLFTITLFAVASLLLDLFNYNPFEATSGQFINFYLSLFLSVSGISSFAYYYVKIKLDRGKTVYAPFWPSVRRGTITGLCLTTLLFLDGMKLLDWWVGASVVVVLALIELFFQTKRQHIKTK